MSDRIINMCRVVSGAVAAYVAGTMQPASIDTQGNVRVSLTSGSNAAGVLSSGATQIPVVASGPLQWTIFNAPAANTIATATKAAGGAGVRHVLQSIIAQAMIVSSANFNANAPVYWVVRDGASGVGTILYQGSSTVTTLAGVNIVGSPDTPMTVEWSVAPGATNFETISAAGYSIALA